MKTIALLLFSFVLASALEDTGRLNKNAVYDYHRRIGIPKAQKIKRLESQLAGNEQRIVGGSTTLIGTVPYQAALLMTVLYVFTSVCGGTILSRTAVLTAAHCYNDGAVTSQSITVVLGSNYLFYGGTRIESTNIIVHPDYNPLIVINDIALIFIPEITYSANIKPIALPSGTEEFEDFAGSQALASGYGVTNSEETVDYLQMLSSVSVQVISNAECESVYRGIIQSQHICTSGENGVGTCRGDSGGPLAVIYNGQEILIGITSFGAAFCESCLPSVYVRLTEFLPWIRTFLETE